MSLLACGVTVGEAAAAADLLAGWGIAARVIGCYSIKPLDVDTVRAAARDTLGLVTVEDHWPEGGLGDAVVSALADTLRPPTVRSLAVRIMPTSGIPAQLLAAAEIDAPAIVKAAEAVVNDRETARARS